MNTIFYFTGTGNSLYLTKRIAEKVDATTSRITADTFNNIPKLEGTIGIIYPIYAWGAPNIVEKFIAQCDFSKVEHLYIVASYAGSQRNALINTQKHIVKAGGTLHAAFALKMGSNYITGGEVTPEAVALRRMEKREDQLAAIITAINEKRLVVPNRSPKVRNIFASGVIHPLFKKMAKKFPNDFSATDSCNSCNICAQVCPTHNVTVENKPVWGESCEMCLACINLCPQKAILYKNTHQDRIRYRYPKISIQELVVSKR